MFGSHTAQQIDSNEQGSTAIAIKLSSDDTQSVYEMMYKARDKWRSIGGIFGVSEDRLENIDIERRSNEEKLRRVIIQRLNASEALTWNDVADALRNATVNQEYLAKEVERKYCHIIPEEDEPRLKDPDSSHSHLNQTSFTFQQGNNVIVLYIQQLPL